jgi:acyl-CoA synthetase (AMP-forming)/AMP-acid ligase II
MDLISQLPSRIHLILEEGASHGGSNIAFIDEGGVGWSYSCLIDTVRETAKELGNQGVRSGDRVMIVGENSIAAIVLMYALSALDAWAVMVNARLGEHELRLIEADCHPRCTFYTHKVSPEADRHAIRASAEIIHFGAIGEIKRGFFATDALPERVFEDPARQVAVLIYTTGTTGHPKGVMLTHRNLTFVASPSVKSNPNRVDDVALCVLPISHSYGLTVMQGLLFAGSRLQIMPRFLVESAINLVTSGSLTIFFSVPAMLARVIKYAEANNRLLKPNRLRYVYTGTAPIDLALRRKVEGLFGVVLHNGYGLTESSPTISRTQYAIGTEEISIGLPIPGIDVKVVGLDEKETLPGQKGELLVRGPNIMLGYYGRPDQTAAAIDEFGYLRTGDIVSREADGVLAIHGRSKELIIRSGFNVYPAEIEGVLNTHPDVLASAVIGRSAVNNEEIIAFIEPVPGADVDVPSILSFLEERLARYKKPQKIIVLKHLPVAPNGKVKKGDLQKYLENLV